MKSTRKKRSSKNVENAQDLREEEKLNLPPNKYSAARQQHYFPCGRIVNLSPLLSSEVDLILQENVLKIRKTPNFLQFHL